jgi:hypothetical protein
MSDFGLASDLGHSADHLQEICANARASLLEPSERFDQHLQDASVDEIGAEDEH